MDNNLSKDLVKDPALWEMLLRVSPSHIDTILYSKVEDNSLIYRNFPIETSSPSHIAAVENIIYDNPALLSDFSRAWCVVETDEFTVIPTECADESTLLFKEAFPESRREVLVDSTGTDNAILVWGLDKDLHSFLRRTFHNITITSHLGSLCKYFSGRATQGNSVKMAVNIRRDALDVIVTSGHKLLLANKFTFTTTDDAAYYILACRDRLGMDPYGDDIILSGDRKIREELTPILRKFVSRVMPAIFPPRMFKAGKDSMHAPFDLPVTPLTQ